MFIGYVQVEENIDKNLLVFVNESYEIHHELYNVVFPFHISIDKVVDSEIELENPEPDPDSETTQYIMKEVQVDIIHPAYYRSILKHLSKDHGSYDRLFPKTFLKNIKNIIGPTTGGVVSAYKDFRDKRINGG